MPFLEKLWKMLENIDLLKFFIENLLALEVKKNRDTYE